MDICVKGALDLKIYFDILFAKYLQAAIMQVHVFVNSASFDCLIAGRGRPMLLILYQEPVLCYYFLSMGKKLLEERRWQLFLLPCP